MATTEKSQWHLNMDQLGIVYGLNPLEIFCLPTKHSLKLVILELGKRK